MMALRYFTNGPATELNGGIDGSQTQLTVASGGANGFPTQYPYTIIVDYGEAVEEVMNVTARANNTLTVERGADDTTALPHSTGAVVVHGVSARDHRESNTHVNATSGIHGLSGSPVGTTDAQTLTNKSISGDTNTLTQIGKTSIVGSPTGDYVGTSDTQTLTNKSINVDSNDLDLNFGSLRRYALRRTGTTGGTITPGDTGFYSHDNSTNFEIAHTGTWSAGTGAHSSQFTVPVTGLYLVSCTVRFQRTQLTQSFRAALQLRFGMTAGSGDGQATTGTIETAVFSAGREDAMGFENSLVMSDIQQFTSTSTIRGFTLAHITGSHSIDRVPFGSHFELYYLGPAS